MLGVVGCGRFAGRRTREADRVPAMKKWLACLGAVAVLAGCSSDPYDPNNPTEAKSQCEGFADKRLKAPATADYELDASDVDGSWTVVGTVDSENSFGAKVRSDVRCVIHFEGERAYLDEISVD